MQAETKKSNDWKRKIAPIFLAILGIGLLAYPWISNYLYQKSVGSQIKTYQEDTKKFSKDKNEEIMKKAREYNEALLDSNVKLTDPFTISNEKITLKYNDVLKLNNNGLMAYIEIPCIDVSLPIFHGTSETILEKGIGHLMNSSLPIGGKSTHSVLTGHTGLSNAKLFTDLTQMKKNDYFFVHVLGRTLAYKVDKIKIVLPEETDDLTIVNNKDYVTLITCTPYGVNDHRLLIRGVRTKYVKDMEKTMKKHPKSQWMSTYQKALLIGILCLILIFIITKIVKKVKSKKER